MDGRTYYIAAARGSGGLNYNFPDTFHLPTQSDTEISFVLMGHYSEGHPLEGESFEQREIDAGGDKELYVHLWQWDNWSIQTEEERFGQEQTQQIGGMALG